MILSTILISSIACFVTIAAPGLFIDISDDNSEDKVNVSNKKLDAYDETKLRIFSDLHDACGLEGALSIGKKIHNLFRKKLILRLTAVRSSAPTLSHAMVYAFSSTALARRA